ncbi:hypothetical protein DFH07DRAFT_769796 [Mycena maculata]|uniref:Uncharacterized protein n=1 Tax=Mycena maculata TaxID=230809 RepID=A0AAD7JMR1_9AGAR|nr:hypothetical protein DFH07DRAFT_769796 [Mycena maculata]
MSIATTPDDIRVLLRWFTVKFLESYSAPFSYVGKILDWLHRHATGPKVTVQHPRHAFRAPPCTPSGPLDNPPHVPAGADLSHPWVQAILLMGLTIQPTSNNWKCHYMRRSSAHDPEANDNGGEVEMYQNGLTAISSWKKHKHMDRLAISILGSCLIYGFHADLPGDLDSESVMNEKDETWRRGKVVEQGTGERKWNARGKSGTNMMGIPAALHMGSRIDAVACEGGYEGLKITVSNSVQRDTKELEQPENSDNSN